jgi:hypothetical protein
MVVVRGAEGMKGLLNARLGGDDRLTSSAE